MSSSSVSTSINTFSRDNAAPDIFSPGPAKLLEKGDQVWGIVQSVKSVGGGLIEAIIGSSQKMAVLLPEALLEKVQGLVGVRAVALRVDDHFACEPLVREVARLCQ
jgi:hypothetical protein